MKENVKAQLSLMGRFEIALNGIEVAYTLKRSTRAQLIWLNIRRQTGLTVTIPYRYDVRCLREYLQDNSKWILSNLAKYCSAPPEPPQASPITTNTISYLGKSLKVMQLTTGSRSTEVNLDQNKLIVNLRPSDRRLSGLELKSWLKDQAAQLINAKVKHFAHLMGLLYNRIRIRDQRSRWGSCSCRKNLNFNWRLIMAPEPVLDYVIIHELCHLKEMSHSRRFWGFVSQYCPRWEEYRGWLDDHCAELNASLNF